MHSLARGHQHATCTTEKCHALGCNPSQAAATSQRESDTLNTSGKCGWFSHGTGPSSWKAEEARSDQRARVTNKAARCRPCSRADTKLWAPRWCLFAFQRGEAEYIPDMPAVRPSLFHHSKRAAAVCKRQPPVGAAVAPPAPVRGESSLPPPRSERAASAARCSPRPCPASPGPRAAHRGRLPRSLPGRRERLPGPGSPAPGAREPPPRPSRRPSRRPVPPSRTVPGDPLWPPLLLPFPSPRTGCERKLSSGKGS